MPRLQSSVEKRYSTSHRLLPAGHQVGNQAIRQDGRSMRHIHQPGQSQAPSHCTKMPLPNGTARTSNTGAGCPSTAREPASIFQRLRPHADAVGLSEAGHAGMRPVKPEGHQTCMELCPDIAGALNWTYLIGQFRRFRWKTREPYLFKGRWAMKPCLRARRRKWKKGRSGRGCE